MKKSHIFKIFAICITMVLISGCNLIKVVDASYIAKVNGEEIKVSEYMYYLAVAKANITQSSGNNNPSADFWTTTDIEGKNAGEVAKEKALDEAIRATLIAQQAKSAGLSADSGTAKTQINKAMNSIASFIEQNSLNTDSVTLAYQKIYLRTKLFDQYQKDGKISATPDQVKDYYNKKYITVKHILFQTKDAQSGTDVRSEDEAKKLADDTIEKIKTGENFDSLVASLSEDPGSKSQPQGYTFAKNGSMVKEFEDASFKLQMGEVSAPVKTSFGYHIIKRYPLTPYDQFIAENPQSSQQQSGEETIKNALISDAETAFVDQWKADAKIEKNDVKYNEIKVS